MSDSQESSQPLLAASDQSKRKFIRGAAIAAPVVLTLRSGSVLAQISACPFQVTATGTLNLATGNLENVDGIPSGGEHCYVPAEGATCTDPRSLHGMGERSLGQLLGDVVVNESSYSCSGVSGGEGSQSVIIVTASSAASLSGIGPDI